MNQKDDKGINTNMVVTFPKEEIKVGVYANAVSLHATANEMVLDFGYMVPNTNPREIQIVSRVNVPMRVADSFSQFLQDALASWKQKMEEVKLQQAKAQEQTPPQQ